jgi:hypothetical protein
MDAVRTKNGVYSIAFVLPSEGGWKVIVRLIGPITGTSMIHKRSGIQL